MRRWLTTSRWPRLLAVSLVLSIVAAVILFTAGHRYRVESIFREAGRLWGEGSYPEAIERYQVLVDDYPDDPLSHQAQYQIGTSYYLFLQKEREAIGTFRSLIRRAPASTYSLKAQRTLGEIYEKRLGDYQQAIVEYQRLIHLSQGGEETGEAQLAVARSYFHLGDIDQAREEYEVHLEKFPGSPNRDRALAGVANCYYVRRAYQSAIRYYRQVIALTDSDSLRAESGFGIAICLEEAGELRQALMEFDKIVDEHPNPELVRQRIERIRQKLSGEPVSPAQGGSQRE